MNRSLLSWKISNPTLICSSKHSASLKNLKTQVGQLALNMQNQNKGAFLSDTQKNPKDYMEIQLRSGKEVSNSSRKEKKEKLMKKKKQLEEKKRRICQKRQ